MQPMFADRDLVLIEPVGVRRFATTRDVQAGDVVVARHPFKNLDVIKHVHEVHEDHHLTLRSPTGDDSRQFGRVPLTTVKGRVTANLTTRSAESSRSSRSSRG